MEPTRELPSLIAFLSRLSFPDVGEWRGARGLLFTYLLLATGFAFLSCMSSYYLEALNTTYGVERLIAYTALFLPIGVLALSTALPFFVVMLVGFGVSIFLLFSVIYILFVDTTQGQTLFTFLLFEGLGVALAVIALHRGELGEAPATPLSDVRMTAILSLLLLVISFLLSKELYGSIIVSLRPYHPIAWSFSALLPAYTVHLSLIGGKLRTLELLSAVATLIITVFSALIATTAEMLAVLIALAWYLSLSLSLLLAARTPIIKRTLRAITFKLVVNYLREIRRLLFCTECLRRPKYSIEELRDRLTPPEALLNFIATCPRCGAKLRSGVREVIGIIGDVIESSLAEGGRFIVRLLDESKGVRGESFRVADLDILIVGMPREELLTEEDRAYLREDEESFLRMYLNSVDLYIDKLERKPEIFITKPLRRRFERFEIEWREGEVRELEKL